MLFWKQLQAKPIQPLCVSKPLICRQNPGLPAERVEKDLTVFSSNCERMEQAVELMQETLAAERRKKEKRLAEATAGKVS